ncbi:MAG: hypothetical protein BMS9Abin05_0664 [Rhodothermia bacterium]|nr:MAG: hypothetical protein BMS9Abin05_0664 [Rhodothermia bacterium]
MVRCAGVRVAESRVLRGTVPQFQGDPTIGDQELHYEHLTKPHANSIRSLGIDRVMRFVFTLLFVLYTSPATVLALQERDLGVVWESPESSILAISDLEDIRAAGITSVRTGPIVKQAILEMADSLGLTLYRELPISRFSARRLLDSTAYAANLLDELLAAGRNHPSAGPIGLAVNSDVSDPNACAYFQEVRKRIRQNPAQQFYYVGSFIENDACNEAVDFVLLDALDESEPVHSLEEWVASRPTRVGLAAVGWRVDPAEAQGLGSSYSSEEQARSLENTIGALADYGSPTIVFVHRWRDQTARADALRPLRDPYNRRYGLNTEDRLPRAAKGVLSAFLQTGQNVFAFTPAQSERFTFPWFVLLGWLLIATVAVLYASSPRFRYMVPRYFMAHGFFRNAVREAREVLPIVSTALLTIMGIAVGMIGTQVFLALHDTSPFKHVLGLQTAQVQSVVNAMLEGPLLSVILIGSIALLAMSIWMGLWMIIASKRAPLLPSQALMLGVWPRWQLLLLLPMIMSIHSLSLDSNMAWMPVLIPLWIGTALWASVRTAYDLYKITNCGPVPAVIVWFFNPVWLSILGIILLSIVQSDHTRFLWHLATRG